MRERETACRPDSFRFPAAYHRAAARRGIPRQLCAIFVTCFASLATLAAENLPLDRIKLPPRDLPHHLSAPSSSFTPR